MFEPTLSIDLGASYTKVAYRPACLPSTAGTATAEAKVLMVDNRPLIPSLAIRTRDPAQPWIFGRPAAAMNPNHEMQVFQNWKANLFRPQNDKDSVTAAIIAHRFFDWLRLKLRQATPVGIDVTQCQTRIAMPAFDTFDENAVLLARCMDLSGWNDPTLILKVREPHANTLGLFAGGRNAVCRYADGRCEVSLRGVFEDDVYQNNVYFRALQQFHVWGVRGNLLTVMVVDIGAFTTDLAKLTFDFNANADGLRAIQQESYALGVINELDKPLIAELEVRHGFSWSDFSFEAQEGYKVLLYQNQPWPLQARVNGVPTTIELGVGENHEVVAKATRQFAAAVWEKIAPFTAGETPSHIYLTGGGSRIKAVAEALRGKIVDAGMHFVTVASGEAPIGTDDQRQWKHTGESLQRLATAVGGASVILQEASAPVHHGPAGLHPQPIPEPPAGFRTCRCQGGNKDCCFCGGRGYCP